MTAIRVHIRQPWFVTRFDIWRFCSTALSTLQRPLYSFSLPSFLPSFFLTLFLSACLQFCKHKRRVRLTPPRRRMPRTKMAFTVVFSPSPVVACDAPLVTFRDQSELRRGRGRSTSWWSHLHCFRLQNVKSTKQKKQLSNDMNISHSINLTRDVSNCNQNLFQAMYNC